MALVKIIHKGKMTVTEPGVTHQEIEQDLESPEYGNVKKVVDQEPKTINTKLPKGTRLGDFEIGKVYQVDRKLATRLIEEKGFEEAPDESEVTGEVGGDLTPSKHAEAERTRALESAAQSPGQPRSREELIEEGKRRRAELDAKKRAAAAPKETPKEPANEATEKSRKG